MVVNKVMSLSNGLKVILELQNARVVKVNPVNKGAEKVNSKGEIIELNYGEDIKFAIEGEYKVNESTYKVQKITRIEDPALGIGYVIYNYMINKSSIFIMPLLAVKGEVRSNFRWETNFCNCFVGTEEEGDYGDYIYLLYRYQGTKEYAAYESYLQNHPWFVAQTDPDNGHVRYQFKPDKLFIEDFKLIIKGKYSKISQISKDRILRFHCVTRNKTLGKILYKDLELKEELEGKLSIKDSVIKIPDDLDLHDIFNIEDEIYLNKYKIKKEIKNESSDTNIFI